MRKNRLVAILLGATAGLALLGNMVTTFSAKEAKAVGAEAITFNQATVDFVASVGESARQIAQENNLYASVMLAQAILESHNGQSLLSQAPYYNFFGIKGAYNGNSVTMSTWEDDGAGNAYTIDADFRSYGSPDESFRDYANLLSSDYYSSSWKSNTYSYQDATAALTGRYATDTLYGTKLNAIIEYYGLTAYDTPIETVAVTETEMTATEMVWNHYRLAYTDQDTLAVDEAWAQRY